MLNRIALCLSLALVGCAGPKPYTAPPMPDDLTSWSTPVLESVAPPTVMPAILEPEATPHEQLFAYVPGHVYIVRVAIGAPLTLRFDPDETILDVVWDDRRPLAPGEDQPPWTVIQPKPDADGQVRRYLYLSVTKPGLAMGLTVTTTKNREYLLDVRSVGKSRIRLVRWDYGPDVSQATPRRQLWPDASQRHAYHLGYQIEALQGAPVWQPQQVLDDGAKTYIFFPRHLAVLPAPMLRLLGPTGPLLANPRQVDTVMVLDHLLDRAELRLGSGTAAEVVQITRGPAQTIQCPGHHACPKF